jgi:hypothetical protein
MRRKTHTKARSGNAFIQDAGGKLSKVLRAIGKNRVKRNVFKRGEWRKRHVRIKGGCSKQTDEEV